MTQKDIDIQVLVKTVVLKVNGKEYELSLEEAEKIHSELDKVVSKPKSRSISGPVINVSTANTDEGAGVAQVGRQLFWDLCGS